MEESFGDFDLELSIELMNLSAIAYLENWPSIIESLGYEVVLGLDESSTDTQGFILWKNEKLIMVFRGTSSLRDFLTDMAFLPSPFPRDVSGSLVHHGFLASYLSVRKKILRALQDFLSTVERKIQLVFAGHSLGAAIATLAAVDVRRILAHPVSLYTFGSPKVGNAAFVSLFQELISASYRLELVGDPIPSLPLVGFSHVPIHILFDENCLFRVTPSFDDRVTDMVNDVTNVFFGRAYEVHHHFNYQRVLNKCRGSAVIVQGDTEG